jgi:DNA-binding XRE family transcriptional regulator
MAGRGHRFDTLKTRRLAGGFTVTSLAKAANVSDQTIVQLENGGTCGPDEAARIVTALCPPVALTSNTQASPTVFTAAANTLVSGDTVTIASVTGANADPNGSRVVTVVNGTSFSVPVNCGVAGGTGGTATLSPASAGFASQL